MSELKAKSDTLWKEALKDLEAGCYNKAISAAYFSVRLAAESILRGIKTRKDDKIANALERLLARKLGRKRAEELKAKYMALFSARKLADHRPYTFQKSQAEKHIKTAEKLRNTILNL